MKDDRSEIIWWNARVGSDINAGYSLDYANHEEK